MCFEICSKKMNGHLSCGHYSLHLSEYFYSCNTLNCHVFKLRKKIEKSETGNGGIY